MRVDRELTLHRVCMDYDEPLGTEISKKVADFECLRLGG